MHVVTYNRKYRGMTEAAGKKDGIHVIAFFFELSRIPNTALAASINNLGRVINPGDEINGGLLNIGRLAPPAHVPYFRYEGSLTTPPCTGKVLWSVYSTPLRISSRQLDQFRQVKLSTKLDPFFGANSRPIQPLNNRLVLFNSH